MQATKTCGPEELRTALRKALKDNKPALIEVPMSETPAPW
jgi:thiamine pyrophosphate-dependent acetolactate synthase large subunit-like protein